jgi:hypothetical protein
MKRRVRNAFLFVGAMFGTVLLVIGVIAVVSNDESGWRGVIGGVLVLALTITLLSRRGTVTEGEG